MGFQDRIRESLAGGGDSSDPPEYRCNGCQHRFNSNQSPRHATCPDCDAEDVELLANPDRAEGSHPLDPRSNDDAGDEADAVSAAASGGATDGPDDAATNEPDDDEAATVRELMTTGQYRCQDCREAFDREGPELVCPDCGSTEIKERF